MSRGVAADKQGSVLHNPHLRFHSDIMFRRPPSAARVTSVKGEGYLPSLSVNSYNPRPPARIDPVVEQTRIRLHRGEHQGIMPLPNTGRADLVEVVTNHFHSALRTVRVLRA